MSESLGPGSTFAGCRIEAIAGQGGMGVVYRATQLTLGRLVALKVIAPEHVEDAAYRERFKRESQLAAMIDHPNIIPVYEAGESDGTLYLIMRWVEGTDLRRTILSRRLTPAQAAQMLRPVASALATAHGQGLVHRDVKPANVLIAAADEQREEHVYLTDFGIARRTATESPLTRTGMFVGTVDYTAPERFIGGKGDSASDIYSFGCMLFETLTGRVPYERPSNVTKVFAHVNDPVPSARTIAPEVPGPLDAVVARAMAKHPGDRFGSAGELTRALDEALGQLDAPEPIIAAETVLSPDETALSPQETAETEPTAPAGVAPKVPTTLDAVSVTRMPPEAVTEERPPGPPPRGRPRGLWAALAILLLAAVAVAVVVLSTSGGGRHAVASEVKSASPGLTTLHTIPLGSAAGAVTIGQLGTVWVSLPDSSAVARIEADGTVTRFAVGGRPTVLAAGPAGIWVAGSSSGALVLLDEQTGRLTASSSLTSTPSALAVDRENGSAWAADSAGNVVHVDPGGKPLGQPAHVAPPVLGLGWGEGWLWAVNGTASGLVRISLDGSGATTVFDTHPGPVSVTFNQGVWTAHSSGNVTRFDPRPNSVKVNTDVSVAPALGLVAAREAQPSVWAISQQSQTLYEISTQPNAPVTGNVVLASPPVGLAVADSSVWVATADGSLTQIGF